MSAPRECASDLALELSDGILALDSSISARHAAGVGELEWERNEGAGELEHADLRLSTLGFCNRFILSSGPTNVRKTR